jgi:hypothetical protein
MSKMLASLLFSPGGTDGDEEPTSGNEGGEIDRGDVRIFLQVEVGFGIRLTPFEERPDHTIDSKKELVHVSIDNKTVKSFSSGDRVISPSDL